MSGGRATGSRETSRWWKALTSPAAGVQSKRPRGDAVEATAAGVPGMPRFRWQYHLLEAEPESAESNPPVRGGIP